MTGSDANTRSSQFALSCVLGAAIAQTLLRGELTTAAYGQLMGAWLVVVIILFGALCWRSPDHCGASRRRPS